MLARILLTLLLLSSAALAQDGWKSVDLSGIHYAVPRGSLQPGRWESELHHTPDCQAPCTVTFDDRLSALHLRYKWDQVNPAPGVYDFDDLGGAIDEAAAAGKMVTLSIMAGRYTPPWVFQAGAAHIDTQAKLGEDFAQAYIPVPWDTGFLAAYDDVINALAAYLKSNPTRYHAVVMVKNGAIVITSEETRLDAVASYDTGLDKRVMKHDKAAKSAFFEELCQDWAAAGYREDRILATMQHSSQTIARAFPDQYIGLAFVAGSNRFPTINKKGNCAPSKTNQTMTKIIKQMVSDYGPRAVVDSTVLTADLGNPPIMQWVVQNGGKIGYQVNQQHAGCNDRKNNPCNEADFRATLQAGLDDGALFIEVHDGNVNRFQDILRQFDAALRNR